MAKGKQRPPMYNRQSGGYQKNVYKNMMKDKNIDIPKPLDQKKITRWTRIGLIAWFVITIVLIFAVNWKVIFGSAVVLAAGVGGMYLYMNNWQTKFVTAYKKMGLPKKEFMKQLKKGGTDEKSMTKISKTWDKINVD